jgi:uracil-DNA glycosylase
MSVFFRLTKTVYPTQNDTFAALNHTPLSKVKVVVVGQDPYHQPQQGHGLAFSVQKGIKIPPSLRNIYKELKTNFPDEFQVPQHGHLSRWAQQGVLLLNSVLTVQRDKPNSHAKKGWEEFTNEILRILHNTPREHGLVLLLWGKPASLKAQTVFQNKNGPHTVIITSHPSPLGATKTNSPFITSQCFRKANEALVKMGATPIDWNVDEPAVPKQKSATCKTTTKEKSVAECHV